MSDHRPGPATERPARLRRRRALYILGLIPSLLLLLVSLRIVLLLEHQRQAMSAYAQEDFDRARDHFAANRVLNPIEPWIAPFGEGAALYRLTDFDDAVEAFGTALETVPSEYECMVRLDLALTHEARGDASSADGHRAEALDAWQEGRKVLAPCRVEQTDTDERTDPDAETPGDIGTEGDSTALDASEAERRARVDAPKVDRRLARKLAGVPFGDPPDPEQPPPADEQTQEKQRKLEERNKQAHADHVEHKDDFDPQPPPPPPPPEPEW